MRKNMISNDLDYEIVRIRYMGMENEISMEGMSAVILSVSNNLTR